MRVKIRELRKAAKLTLEEFAPQVGMSRSMLAQKETGKCRVTVEDLESFARAFGVPITQLIESDWLLEPANASQETVYVYKPSRTRAYRRPVLITDQAWRIVASMQAEAAQGVTRTLASYGLAETDALAHVVRALLATNRTPEEAVCP